jgi:hypothetical protein
LRHCDLDALTTVVLSHAPLVDMPLMVSFLEERPRRLPVTEEVVAA